MLEIGNLFDEKFYLATYSDAAQAVANGTIQNGLTHFTQFGQYEGRNPSALFDTAYYLTNYADVKAAVERNEITAVGHFISNGQFELRNPSALFDNSYYLSNHSDVQNAVSADQITAIEHFVQNGASEGRNPSTLFNSRYYLARNQDVGAAVERDEITGIQHYIQYGAAENRQFTPFITPGGSTLPNGVAAGDTTQTSTVLWTRSTAPGVVQFEYSTDRNFTNIIGVLTSEAIDPTLPVKVQINNLTSATQYFYRVTDAAGTSATGEFLTPAALGTRNGLRFGVGPDMMGQIAPFPSITNAPSRNLDFFMMLGDTVYADYPSPDLPVVRQPKTLTEFRTKYNEVYNERYGLNTWADLKASTPVYGVWDDHEITDDFVGGTTPARSPQREGVFGTGNGFVNDTLVFEDALQAFQEYLPLRNEFYGDTGDPSTAGEQKLYRYNTFGSDAAMFTLDLRSFRDASLPKNVG